MIKNAVYFFVFVFIFFYFVLSCNGAAEESVLRYYLIEKIEQLHQPLNPGNANNVTLCLQNVLQVKPELSLLRVKKEHHLRAQEFDISSADWEKMCEAHRRSHEITLSLTNFVPNNVR